MRPNEFDINYDHSLANGLIYAMMGQHGGTNYIHDSSLSKGNADFVGDSSDWQWHHEDLGRRVLECSNYINTYLDQEIVTDVTFDTTTFSVAAWVRVGEDAADGSFLGHYSELGYQWIHLQVLYLGENWFWAWLGDGTAEGWVSINCPGLSGVNAWHHVCITRVDGATPLMYVDGVSKTVSGTATNTCTAQIILRGQYSSLNGAMADVMVYDRALSSHEVVQLADPSNTMLSGLIRPVGDKKNIYDLEGIR